MTSKSTLFPLHAVGLIASVVISGERELQAPPSAEVRDRRPILAGARLQTIVWTADVEAAAFFYGNVLELPLVARSLGALVYDVGGSELRLSPVPSTSPSPHTVLGFSVADVRAVARALAAKGVRPVLFANFDHDPEGVWTAPDGTTVMWFRDPDGNLLSIVHYADR